MNEARLYQILGYKREHDTEGERLMLESVLFPYKPSVFTDVTGDALAYGITIGMPDGTESRTLFSAHVDTVHGSWGTRSALRTLPEGDDFVNHFRIDAEKSTVHADGDVLGADDGAGMWLLLEMIDAGVPGTYVFHRGEECGGIGSSGMVTHHWGFLSRFDRAIAFDRKATHSIITHQRGRCCSDTFAEALAAALTCDTYFMGPDATGVFTDTANYTDDIAECTNVSVGYYNEHHTNESLDLSYLFALRGKCLTLDWEALPTERKPGEVDLSYTSYFSRPTTLAKPEFTADDMMDMEFEDILELCETQPYEAAVAIYAMIWGQGPSEEEQGIVETGDHYDNSVDVPERKELTCAGYYDAEDIWEDDDWGRLQFPTNRLKVGMQ